MRIAAHTMYDQIRTDIGRITDEMAKTEFSISSGKIYSTPSDAPVALTHALSIKEEISDTQQYQRNITYAKGWIAATSSALSQIQDRLLRAKTLAVEGANDSQNADSRKAMAEEVKTILNEVVALGNTKMGDRYIFGGTKTRGYNPGEAPFVVEPDGSIKYLGNRENLAINVAEGQSMTINVNGHDALIQSGVFSALKDLEDALNANSQTDIERAMSEINTSLSYMNQQISSLGAKDNALSVHSDMEDQLLTTSKERLSDIEDTDIVKAITDLKTEELSYQAALSAASKVMKLSLVNYL